MGLFDDIIASDKGKGSVSTAPKPTIFDDIIKESKAKNGANLSPSLQNDKEILGEASQFGSSLARTIVGIPGALGTIANMGGAIGDAAREKGYLPPIPKDSVFNHKMTDSEDVAKWVENNIPGSAEYIGREPTTAGERAANVLGSFAANPGKGARNIITTTAIPAATTAVVSEAAHQGLVPGWAAPVSAVVSGVFSKGASHVVAPENTAGKMIAGAFDNVTLRQIADAESLINDARAQGIGLTWPEAVQQVTGGATKAGNLQRVVEGMGGMREFMGKRPDQIRAANEAMFSQIAETPSNPSVTGQRISEAAQQAIIDANKERTNLAGPFFKAAADATVPPEVVGNVVSKIDELLAQDKTGLTNGPLGEYRGALISQEATPAVPSVRTPVTNPDTGKVIRYDMTPGTPAKPIQYVTDIENLNRTRKYFRDRGELPAFADKAIDKETASKIGGFNEQLDVAMKDASPMYRAGNEVYQQATRDIIDPLLAGPIGKLAEKHDVKNAISALFPSNPVPNSAGEVMDAVTKLSNKNPWAARQLVRAHVESVFNQATKDLQSGANEFGGAGFRAKLIGNKQQAENLAASIAALPGGKNILSGFDRMMDIMEATGQRQRIGSNTSFNNEVTTALKSGGGLGEIVASGGTNLPSRIRQKFEEWNMGKNVDEIARLLTDPKAADAFKTLALAGRGTSKEMAAVNRIYGLSSSLSGYSARNR